MIEYLGKLFYFLKCWYFHLDVIEKENIKLGSYHKCKICSSEYLSDEILSNNNKYFDNYI